jgi:hypothetical protein
MLGSRPLRLPQDLKVIREPSFRYLASSSSTVEASALALRSPDSLIALS